MLTLRRFILACLVTWSLVACLIGAAATWCAWQVVGVF